MTTLKPSACATCGTDITQPPTGRTRLYCSDHCRDRARYQRLRNVSMRGVAAQHVMEAAVLANRLSTLQTFDPIIDNKLHAISHDLNASLHRHLPEVFSRGE